MPTRQNAETKTRVKTKSSQQTSSEIQPAKGKLGIMIPGMGAVATTIVAGVEAVRKGLAKPIGSLTQMGTIRLGKRTEPVADDQGIRSAGGIERRGVYGMGHFQGQHV